MTKTTKRRTQIEIETREITFVRAGRDQKKHYCENCRARVPAFEIEHVAGILRQDTDEVRLRIDAAFC